jgi:hypothetical protein
MKEAEELIGGNGSPNPLQEQKLALEKALKVAKSVQTPRSVVAGARHKLPEERGATTRTGSSDVGAAPARDGPADGSGQQNARLECENSKLQMRIAELERKEAELRGGDAGASGDKDLAYEIFQQFATKYSAERKMTREEFKLAVESTGDIAEGNIDDLFDDMDTNHDNFIDPDEWKVETMRRVSLPNHYAQRLASLSSL